MLMPCKLALVCVSRCHRRRSALAYNASRSNIGYLDIVANHDDKRKTLKSLWAFVLKIALASVSMVISVLPNKPQLLGMLPNKPQLLGGVKGAKYVLFASYHHCTGTISLTQPLCEGTRSQGQLKTTSMVLAVCGGPVPDV